MSNQLLRILSRTLLGLFITLVFGFGIMYSVYHFGAAQVVGAVFGIPIVLALSYDLGSNLLDGKE